MPRDGAIGSRHAIGHVAHAKVRVRASVAASRFPRSNAPETMRGSRALTSFISPRYTRVEMRKVWHVVSSHITPLHCSRRMRSASTN